MSVLPPLAKLYLREFFTGYFAENQRKEELHAFTSGLEVLEDKLSAFQQKQLQWVDKLADTGDGMPMPTVLIPSPETEDDGLNVRFQSIYDRIKSLMQVEEIILERMSYQAKRAQTVGKPGATLCDVIPENELYELLGDFRQRNKQLETKNQSLRAQISQLSHSLSLDKEETVQKDEQIVIARNDINRLEELRLEIESQLREKQVQLGVLQVQKGQLADRLHRQDRLIEELQIQHRSDLDSISVLKERAITEQQKIARFNELLDERMANTRQQLLSDIKQTVANKQNHNKAMLTVLKQVFARQAV